MSVQLSDEQYGIMMNTLLDVANGYWWRDGKMFKRISRSDAVNTCRKAANDLGLDWQKRAPERPKPPGIDAFAAAGRGKL
jgi:hypothetical protein